MEKKQEEIKEGRWHKTFTDISGWKRDTKKIGYALLILIAVGGVYYAVANVNISFPWGFNFANPVEFVKYQKYSGDNLDLEFSYADKYVFDDNEKDKYSKDYLAGFHLKTDQRTGCDVRVTDIGINFAKSDDEIKAAIKNDLAAHVNGFAEFSGKKIKINREPAMFVDFLLIDPLGNTLRINQVMTSHKEKSYLLICGTGESHYKFYKDDFDEFLESIRWKNK